MTESNEQPTLVYLNSLESKLLQLIEQKETELLGKELSSSPLALTLLINIATSLAFQNDNQLIDFLVSNHFITEKWLISGYARGAHHEKVAALLVDKEARMSALHGYAYAGNIEMINEFIKASRVDDSQLPIIQLGYSYAGLLEPHNLLHTLSMTHCDTLRIYLAESATDSETDKLIQRASSINKLMHSGLSFDEALHFDQSVQAENAYNKNFLTELIKNANEMFQTAEFSVTLSQVATSSKLCFAYSCSTGFNFIEKLKDVFPALDISIFTKKNSRYFNFDQSIYEVSKESFDYLNDFVNEYLIAKSKLEEKETWKILSSL